MSYRTNLAVQTVSKLSIVGKIEDVLQNRCAHFSHNPKRTQEIIKLADIVETKG
jgi:hypothetical protein